MRPLDVLFINADSSAAAYQDLAKTLAAIEPPTWSLLLAQSCRTKGYGVAILDATAERLTHEQAVARVGEIKPRLACFVVYGQNPNSGSTNRIAKTQRAALPRAALSTARYAALHRGGRPGPTTTHRTLPVFSTCWRINR